MVHSKSSAEHHGHHIIPFKTLLTVFLALIGLTVVTVLAAQIHLGPLNVPIALAIAIAKAACVVSVFMGLRYDRPVNALVFAMGIVFVLIFLTFTWFDTGFRGDLGNVDHMTIQERTYAEEQLRAREPGPAAGTVPSDTTAADTTGSATGAGVNPDSAAGGSDTPAAGH